jgi:hypothetical protein
MLGQRFELRFIEVSGACSATVSVHATQHLLNDVPNARVRSPNATY